VTRLFDAWAPILRSVGTDDQVAESAAGLARLPRRRHLSFGAPGWLQRGPWRGAGCRCFRGPNFRSWSVMAPFPGPWTTSRRPRVASEGRISDAAAGARGKPALARRPWRPDSDFRMMSEANRPATPSLRTSAPP